MNCEDEDHFEDSIEMRTILNVL